MACSVPSGNIGLCVIGVYYDIECCRINVVSSSIPSTLSPYPEILYYVSDVWVVHVLWYVIWLLAAMSELAMLLISYWSKNMC